MRPKLFVIATIFATLVGSVPAPSPLNTRDDEKDPTDLGFIQKIAAIGDSYSAGIGAGNRLQNVISGLLSSIIPFLADDWKCSRYSRSYPFTINRILFGDKRDNFQFLSCSGALADEVTDGQVPSLEGDKDLILVSAGGNDAELVWILNHCVFQFFSPTELAMDGIELAVDSALTAVGEPEIAPAVNLFIQYHKEKLTRGCDQQLAATESIIKSDAFTKRIERLIEKTKEKLKKDTGTLVYTGYARFWDSDIVDNDYCSKKENSWSMFYNFDDPTKLLSEKAFLTKDRRDKMNSLVDLMNKRLEDIVKSKATKNSKGQDDAIFVNYDQYYGDVDGRFCTKGVSKPEKDRTADLTFYPLDFNDPFGSKNFKRSEAVEVYNGTFEAHVDYLAVLADAKGLHYRTEVPKVKAKAKTLGIGSDGDGDAVKAADDNMSHLRKRSILPDGFGRTFHPTIAGHDIIARLILWKLSDRNAKIIGRSFGPEVGSAISDSCPAPDSNLPQLSAKCTGSNGASSGLPANVFYHAQDKRGIFDEFCKQIDEKKLDDSSPHKWIVNAKGEKQSGQSKRKRTPPPNPNAYKQIISLDWVPNKNNHNCRASCSQAYQNMAQSGCGTLGGQQNVMAVKAKFDNGCGTFSYEVTGQGVPEAEPASCYNDPVLAPKGDREVENGKGTSVEAAYKKFCEDNDGKTLEAPVGSDLIAQRHDITSWGVEGRASFWLRASFIQGCDGKVTINKNECLEKMGRGLGHCEVNSGFTHGFQASGECVNYAVQTTYSTREDGAPWNPGAVKPSWPPPENVDDKKPGCAKAPSPKLSDEDLNKAIDYFCQDGKPFKDSDTLLDVMKIYPPQDQPGFYAKEGKSNRLIMMAVKLTDSDRQRYKDMTWCKNYDWKMGKDDCTYALRKLHHQCIDDKGGLLGGDFIYRCVNYRSWSDNF